MLAEIIDPLSATLQPETRFAILRACRSIAWAAKMAAQEKTSITDITNGLLYKSSVRGQKLRYYALLLGFTSTVLMRN